LNLVIFLYTKTERARYHVSIKIVNNIKLESLKTKVTGEKKESTSKSKKSSEKICKPYSFLGIKDKV